MQQWSERGLRTWVVVAALSASAPAALAAQGSIFEKLNLDRLRLTAVGVSVGPVVPARIEPTQGYSIQADYGEIARKWRIVFIATYWGSHFKDRVVHQLERRLRENTIDPSGDDTLSIGRINVSDIALETDVRYTPLRTAGLRPFVGGAFGAHIINAENRFIQGTIVESALDNIAFGVTGLAGVDSAPFHGFALNLQGRVSLISNARFVSLRAGGSYHFNTRQPSRTP
ncbi:MAG TPA: hypothetical protein VFS05_12665 [Gemmatimonadaceae bacterium]|nr:hypothetical protein [Gemmatimonadaceae bacterium]